MALLAALCVVSFPSAAPPPQEDRPPLQWRLPGAAGSLEPTAWVRLQVTNKLGPDEVNERFGLVQTAAYLFAAGIDTQHSLLALADRHELDVRRLDADLVAGGGAAAPLLVTLEPLIGPDHYAVGAVLGRAVRLVATPAVEKIAAAGGHLPVGAIRVDRADLEDRQRWAADTLVLPGQTRILWEGAVRLSVDRLYADYLFVRAPGLDITQHQPNVVVRDNMRSPEGGILDLPPRPRPLGAPVSVTLGSTLSRMSGRRLFPVSLQQGVLNVIDLRAVIDPLGEQELAVVLTTGPLDQIRDRLPRGE